MPPFESRTVDFKRLYVHPAQDQQIDAQGRVLVPVELRDYAGLGKEAVFTGDLQKFQLWSQPDWENGRRQLDEARQDPSFFGDFSF